MLAPRALLGSLLRPSWSVLESSSAVLKASWASLRPLGPVLGPPLGTPLARRGPFRSGLGPSRELWEPIHSPSIFGCGWAVFLMVAVVVIMTLVVVLAATVDDEDDDG